MKLAGEWVYWLPEPSSRKISTAWSHGPNVIRRSRTGKKSLHFGQNSKPTSTKWQRFAWKATLPEDLKASVWMVTVSQSCKTFNLKLNAILGIVEKSLLSRMLGEIALICSNRVTPLPPIQGSGRLFHLRKPIRGPLWMSYVTYVGEKVWFWERWVFWIIN